MKQPPRRPAPADDRDEALETEHDEEPGEGREPVSAQDRGRVPPLWGGARRVQLVALAVGALGQAALVLVAALAARRALDGAAGAPAGGAADPVPWLTLTAAALLGVALLRWWKAVLGERLAQDHIRDMRLALFDTLSSLSAQGRQRRSRGAVMLRFLGDAQALRDWAAQGAPGLVAATLAAAALLLGLALLAAPLAGLAATWFALAAIGMAATLPPLAQRVREVRLRQAYLAANVHDRIASVPVMQSAARTPQERGRLGRQLDRLAQAAVHRVTAQARHRWWLDLALGGLALSVITLWSLKAAGALGLGPLFDGVGVLVGALGMIGLLSAPLRRVGRALEQWVAARVAQDRMAEFLADAEPVPPARSAPLPRAPALRLAGVPLPQRPQHPLAAQVAPGSCVALVGPAGSGKTALLETLARQRPLVEGEIELGEQALARIGLREFARRVSHVGAEAPLLRGSVESNLRYRRRRAGLEELVAAAAAAGWPGPLDAQALGLRVRDGGSNLSGHQRRALVLARALVGRPALLLVDDIEHLLDSADPVGAFARLRQAHRGTLVFSTHDGRIAALADDRWLLGGAAGEAAPLRLVAGAWP